MAEFFGVVADFFGDVADFFGGVADFFKILEGLFPTTMNECYYSS